MNRLLKKLFKKGAVRQLQSLSLPQVKEKAFPLSVDEQLAKWEKELKKESIKQLLSNGQLDQRLLNPVIIFQPGKVGSTSVHKALTQTYKDIGLYIPVFHAHILENIDQRIEKISIKRANPRDTIDKLEENKELRKNIDLHPEWSWNIVSLVRDPVAIRISAFFQLLNEYLPGWQKQLASGALTLTELQSIFYEKGGLNTGGLDHWFDNQIKPIWKVDVYDSPFAKEKGYQIYQQYPKVNLMIVRLEDLNTVAKDAFYDFLGVRDFAVVQSNVGSKKAYSELYNQFKTLAFPIDAIDDAYTSRYALHFYTKDEIATFRKRWALQ